MSGVETRSVRHTIFSFPYLKDRGLRLIITHTVMPNFQFHTIQLILWVFWEISTRLHNKMLNLKLIGVKHAIKSGSH